VVWNIRDEKQPGLHLIPPFGKREDGRDLLILDIRAFGIISDFDIRI
jgi:hypothetical protein